MSPRNIHLQRPELILQSQPMADIRKYFEALVKPIVRKKLPQWQHGTLARPNQYKLPSEDDIIDNIVQLHRTGTLHAAANEIHAANRNALSKYNGTHHCLKTNGKKQTLKPSSDCIFCTTVHAKIIRAIDSYLEKYIAEQQELEKEIKQQQQRARKPWKIQHP